MSRPIIEAYLNLTDDQAKHLLILLRRRVADLNECLMGATSRINEKFTCEHARRWLNERDNLQCLIYSLDWYGYR